MRCTRSSRRCSSGASSTTPTPTGTARERTGQWRATSSCATATATCCGSDIYRYFPAIDHEVLKADLRRRIACRRTLAVLDRIIDASNPQEPVHLYYPGDDLLTPLERRRGLPIGNLTSQLFANVYLDRFDHFVTEVLRAPYLRYVDDFALFADDPARLVAVRATVRGGVPGSSPAVAAPCEDARGGDVGPGDVPRLRAASRRPPSAAGGERAAIPQPSARAPRSLAGGYCHAGGGGAAGSRLGGARGARRVRGGCAVRSSGAGGSRRGTAGPGGLTGPRPPCVARRLLEQQCREPPAWRAQQEHRRQPEQQPGFSCFEHAPRAGAGAVTAASGARGSVQGRS